MKLKENQEPIYRNLSPIHEIWEKAEKRKFYLMRGNAILTKVCMAQATENRDKVSMVPSLA